MTFKPIESVSIRGAWGKSFVAPSLADSFIADPTAINWIDGATLNFIAPPAVLAANGFPPVGAGQKIMFLLGFNPGLQPQKATTWSVGLDIQPAGVPGLKMSTTYYNIRYSNIIQLVPFFYQSEPVLLGLRAGCLHPQSDPGPDRRNYGQCGASQRIISDPTRLPMTKADEARLFASHDDLRTRDPRTRPAHRRRFGAADHGYRWRRTGHNPGPDCRQLRAAIVVPGDGGL